MTFESQTGIRLTHALPVIDDLDRSPSGILNKHIDMPGTGIDGILHQLLDDGSRTLDDLPSSNLVGYGIG